MAQSTFGEVWNKILLYAPNTPVPLAQQFVKDAYITILNAHEWSEQLSEGEKTIASEYATGTVTVTSGSTTVTMVTGTVTTDWENTRQLAVKDNNGYAPFYDIVAVDTTSNTLTLDRAYQGPTDASAEFLVAEYFLEIPDPDFHLMLDIRDATRSWRLRRQYHQASYLDRIDPRRIYSGTPILYVPAPPRTSSGVSYARFEFWPRIPSSTKLVYRYIKKTELSSSSDRPLTVVPARVLVYGALALLTLWPGTAERPNPYFSTDLNRNYQKLFDDSLQEALMCDLERAQNMLVYAEDDRGYPADSRFIQEHGLA